MDLLLENGDLKKDSAGKPIPISGFDELKQQIYIRLKAKLGTFSDEHIPYIETIRNVGYRWII